MDSKLCCLEADQSFGQISELLKASCQGLVKYQLQIGSRDLTFSEEAIKIMEEASAIVERIRDRFPDLYHYLRLLIENNLQIIAGRKETSIF